LTKDGSPLNRKYYCPEHEKELDSREIIRGYDRDGTFITVEDEELSTLEPRKSSDIELKQFVRVEEIDPLHFDRPYYLAPTGRSTKAYRLLVHVMEKEGRAGISTFIMHGKEYLAAILAEGGILMLETLRYRDEIRSPERIGMGEGEGADKDKEKIYARALSAFKADRLSRDDLEDRYAKRFRDLLDRRKKSPKAVVKVEEKEEPEAEEGGQIIDFVSIFKKRLAEKEKRERPRSARRR
jgi:DNA end-binding protein Ku